MANPDDRHDADAGDRSSSYLQRRAPAVEAEADSGDRSSSYLQRRAPAVKAEADSGDRSSSYLQRRAPAVEAEADDRVHDRSSSLRLHRAATEAKAGEARCSRRENDDAVGTRPPVKPAAASGTGAQRGGRQGNGVGGDTQLPPNAALEAGEVCGGPQQRNSNCSQLRVCGQVTASGTGSEFYIDPDYVYTLYGGGQLEALLAYIQSFPTASTNRYCQVIKELAHISMRLTEGCVSSELPGPTSSLPKINSNDGEITQMIPLGSRFWDRPGCLIPNVPGIRPLRFYGCHPVWEGHAVPVEKDNKAKVEAFFCTYCEKEFAGNAKDAVRHMLAVCKIPQPALQVLVTEVKQYKERRDKLRSASKAKERKSRTGNAVPILQENDAGMIMELVQDLFRSEEYDTLDITTGTVIMMTTSLVTQAEEFLRDGINLTRIVEGYQMASRIACDHLEHISENFKFSAVDKKPFIFTCMAALNKYKQALTDIAVEAVFQVADLERKGVNLDLVGVKVKAGRKLSTELVKGIVIDKLMSHPEMTKRVAGAKIAFLNCSFEPSNNTVAINTVEPSNKLFDQKQKYVDEMVQKCKGVGANLVICQWDFDDKVSNMFMQRKLPAVRGVSASELESIARATGGQIVPRFEELSVEKLGKAKSVREKRIGKTKECALYIESCANSRTVTVLIRGASNLMIEDITREFSVALRVARNLIIADKFVCAAGSAEISCSIALGEAADAIPGSERPFIKSFAHALDAIPLALAEKTGLPPVETLKRVKFRHVKERNPYLGIDCNNLGTEDMVEQGVFASLEGKQKQMLLALKVLKTIFRLDEVT